MMITRGRMIALIVSIIIGCGVSYGTDARRMLSDRIDHSMGGYSVAVSDTMVGMGW